MPRYRITIEVEGVNKREACYLAADQVDPWNWKRIPKSVSVERVDKEDEA